MDKYIEEVKEIVELITDLVEGGAVINKYHLKESLNAKLKDLIQSTTKEAVEEFVKEIEKIFPPTFVREVEYGKGILENGKQEETAIRRLSNDEQNILNIIYQIKAKELLK